MSFKSNPWLTLNEKTNTKVDPDIYKQAIFIFSGTLLEIPTASYEGKSGDESALKSVFIRDSRRFNNDKIQCAELITKTQGSYQ